MECLSGGTLKDLKDRLQLGENPIKFMYIFYFIHLSFTFSTHNVLSGLVFLHERHLGHRGIRSDHLMFSHNGTVKIIDFSQACDFSQGILLRLSN
jgi:serine/threonine protein kinase